MEGAQAREVDRDKADTGRRAREGTRLPLPALRRYLDSQGEGEGDMNGADFRQQQEDDEARMAHNLAALERIARAGLPEIAQELAAELGLKDQFNHKEKH